METNNNKKKVMFVSGAFVSNHCWDEWITYFDTLGYEAIAPAWPFKEGTAKSLRDKQPYDTDLATLTLAEVIDHYADVATSFDEKPIIIGHSLGGMITQILVNRGLAQAGVAIHPVAPQGVFPYEFKFLRATWGVLGLFSSLKETYMMPFKDFQRTFANNMPLDQQISAYNKYAIPESKTAARGGLTSVAAVDFKKEHAPLLITAGGLDNLVPLHLNQRNYKKYKKNNSVLDFKEFPNSNHGILTHPDWKTEADYILNWVKNNIS